MSNIKLFTMGRKHIVMEKIENLRNRQFSFYKRKRGLLKKAMEIATLCGVKITLCIVDAHERVILYSSEELKGMLNKYILPNQDSFLGTEHGNKKKNLFCKRNGMGTHLNSTHLAAKSRRIRLKGKNLFVVKKDVVEEDENLENAPRKTSTLEQISLQQISESFPIKNSLSNDDEIQDNLIDKNINNNKFYENCLFCSDNKNIEINKLINDEKINPALTSTPVDRTFSISKYEELKRQLVTKPEIKLIYEKEKKIDSKIDEPNKNIFKNEKGIKTNTLTEKEINKIKLLGKRDSLKKQLIKIKEENILDNEKKEVPSTIPKGLLNNYLNNQLIQNTLLLENFQNIRNNQILQNTPQFPSTQQYQNNISNNLQLQMNNNGPSTQTNQQYPNFLLNSFFNQNIYNQPQQFNFQTPNPNIFNNNLGFGNTQDPSDLSYYLNFQNEINKFNQLTELLKNKRTRDENDNNN